MKNFLRLILIVNLSLLISGYYVHELTNKEARLIPTLRIHHDIDDEHFPHNFTVDLHDFEGDTTKRLNFIRVLRTDSDHPIASDDVYTNSRSDLVRVSDLNNNYETYRLDNGRGYATLIRNDMVSTNKYRMLGSIRSADMRTIHDIIPAQSRKTTKRSIYDSETNSHYLAKRETLNAPCLSDVKRSVEEQVQTKRIERAVDGKPVTVYVEHLLTADKTLFDYYSKLLNSTDKKFVFEIMRVYYSHFFTQVNDNFAIALADDPDIRVVVKLKNFIFYTAPTEWTDNKKNGIPGYPTFGDRDVIGLRALDSFAKYMAKNPPKFDFDVAVSMFRQDIWQGDSPDGASVLGVAKGSGACNKSTKYYIMEEMDTFLYVTVASHELAHTLGVDHDESYPECSSDSGYIMAAGMIPIGAPNPNYGKFSKCSINAFKNKLLNKDLSAVSDQFMCLKNEPSIKMTDWTNQIFNNDDFCKVYNGNKNSAYCNLPGQVISPDEQCKWMHGRQYEFYTDGANTSCEALSCLNMDTYYFRNLFPALEGTQCGSGKVCLNKQCVENTEISNSDLECPFQDAKVNIERFRIPNMPGPLMDCESYLSEYYSKFSSAPVYGCTYDYVKSTCCRACRKYQDFKCFDPKGCSMYSNYPEEFCKNYDYIREGCPKLCKTCSSSTVTCNDLKFPCQNGGTCVNVKSNSVISYKCKCPTGFKGFLCETPDPCAKKPCPKGTCKSVGSLNKFICLY